MNKLQQFLADGYSIVGGTKNPQGFLEWKLNLHDTTIATFYGPSSFMACMACVKTFIDNPDFCKGMGPAIDLDKSIRKR